MSTETGEPRGTIELQNGGPDEEIGNVTTNGNVDFGTSAFVKPHAHSQRQLKRVKRHPRTVSTGDIEEEGGELTRHQIITEKQRLPFLKNSRKSRNGFGRGLPKKGGAGGKGVWGKPGSELDADVDAMDEHDPNYDDTEISNGVKYKSYVPELTPEDVKQGIEPLMHEYFENGDVDDVIQSIDELKLRSKKNMVTYHAISCALDRKAHHREMTSVLISELYSQLLSPDQIAFSFKEILEDLSELVLDTPDAAEISGQFLARAIADDCLPPKFIKLCKENVQCPTATKAIDKADTLLNMKHGIVRLDNVWGVGGGIRPVKALKKKMVLLLQEYLSASDIAEATHCLVDLDVPHFHHELVYEAVVMMIEESSERSCLAIVNLLKSLCDAVIITPDQMNVGIRRVYEEMPDISIDVPMAYTLLDRFINKCFEENIIEKKLFDDCPSRPVNESGRKRFVSEGDGGLVKCDRML